MKSFLNRTAKYYILNPYWAIACYSNKTISLLDNILLEAFPPYLTYLFVVEYKCLERGDSLNSKIKESCIFPKRKIQSRIS